MAVCYDVEEVMDHEKIDGYRVSVKARSDRYRRFKSKEFFIPADYLASIDYTQANIYTICKPEESGYA